jgi:hypothetical protein
MTFYDMAFYAEYVTVPHQVMYQFAHVCRVPAIITTGRYKNQNFRKPICPGVLSGPPLSIMLSNFDEIEVE